MDDAHTLRGRIKQLIAPHIDKPDKPPFSEDQLVVITLTMADDSLTVEDVCSWIIDTFRYHRELARACLVHMPHLKGRRYALEKNDRLRSSVEFHRKMNEAFWRFEIPFITLESGEETKYTISLQDSEQLLRRIWPENVQHADSSRFFGLPAELRATIYEMVFQYPQSGIILQDRKAYHKPQDFALLSRSFDDEFDFRAWHSGSWDPSHERFRTYPLRDILAPLLTSRQFYSEAMPTLYAVNRFHFPNLRELQIALDALHLTAPGRMQHIAHVSFTCALDYSQYAVSAFTALARLKGLQTLEICVDEKAWGERSDRFKGTRKYKSSQIVNMSGLVVLRRQVEADKVVFHGPCPTLETMLKADMTRCPKTALAGPGKRKDGRSGGRKTKTKTEKEA
ncbi:hypothetical protein LTR36_004999 [Oleoguttula mirabilis]|uniref:DUF7730 domain-containing protein n=1 Tax=Oleoguttula mirabilis TaxID=1507867 RepID=A0AAV9JVH2_9PEZI|nr:hypothetical protein LTR36_004999 [Oleoguttula mirabilis]